MAQKEEKDLGKEVRKREKTEKGKNKREVGKRAFMVQGQCRL